MQRRKQTAIDVTVAVAKSESFVRHVTRKFCKNKKVFRMKDFFCTHFSIRIVFLITHAWKQEFPHPRSSQYLLQKYLRCFTVYSTSAHYRHDNSMKYFFVRIFSIRIVFLIIHAWKQEFPHTRYSQYPLQKYLRCFTVYSTSAHYRHDNSMKYFFVRIFSIRIVFLIIHAWKQEFPHLRYSQYPLQNV